MKRKRQMTARAVAECIGARLTGNSDFLISGMASPAAASEEDVIIVFKNAEIGSTRARVAVVANDHALPGVETLLHVDEPRVAFARLSALFAPLPHDCSGQHPTACVAPDADVHPEASIGPFCVVEAGARIGAGTTLLASCYVGSGVSIGSGCLLYPSVVLYSGTELGDRVIVHANTTVGLDGFAFVTEDPIHPKVHSLGQVIVEDDVEIGAGTGIQRGTLDPTRIGRGTKIGSQIEIGHNCRIGEYCLLVGQIGMAGSVTVGDRVSIAAGVIIRDHVNIGANSTVMMGSHVVRDAPPGSVLLGSPAQDHRAEKSRYRGLTDLVSQTRSEEAGRNSV